MTIYVATIAILNLAVGFFLAKYMGAGHRQLSTALGESFDQDEHTAE